MEPKKPYDDLVKENAALREMLYEACDMLQESADRSYERICSQIPMLEQFMKKH